MNQRQTRCAATVTTIAGLTLFAAQAYSACWNNPSLTNFASQIAARHFPALQGRMPDIVECDAADFGPNIHADYTSGVHRIRIPVWQRQQPMDSVRGTIAHELAHAVLEGQDPTGPNGHGAAFYRVLINAGFAAEAQRVAGVYGNFDTLARVGGAEMAPPPGALGAAPPIAPPAPPMQPMPPVAVRRWVTVCSVHPVTHTVYLPHLRALQQVTVMQQICRQVVQLSVEGR